MNGSSKTIKPLKTNGDVKLEKRRQNLEFVMEKLRDFSDEKFTGYVKVNYTQGTIARVEKFEEILKKR